MGATMTISIQKKKVPGGNEVRKVLVPGDKRNTVASLIMTIFLKSRGHALTKYMKKTHIVINGDKRRTYKYSERRSLCDILDPLLAQNKDITVDVQLPSKSLVTVHFSQWNGTTMRWDGPEQRLKVNVESPNQLAPLKDLVARLPTRYGTDLSKPMYYFAQGGKMHPIGPGTPIIEASDDDGCIELRMVKFGSKSKAVC